jgi:hypothetical protein
LGEYDEKSALFVLGASLAWILGLYLGVRAVVESFVIDLAPAENLIRPGRSRSSSCMRRPNPDPFRVQLGACSQFVCIVESLTWTWGDDAHEYE